MQAPSAHTSKSRIRTGWTRLRLSFTYRRVWRARRPGSPSCAFLGAGPAGLGWRRVPSRARLPLSVLDSGQRAVPAYLDNGPGCIGLLKSRRTSACMLMGAVALQCHARPRRTQTTRRLHDAACAVRLAHPSFSTRSHMSLAHIVPGKGHGKQMRQLSSSAATVSPHRPLYSSHSIAFSDRAVLLAS